MISSVHLASTGVCVGGAGGVGFGLCNFKGALAKTVMSQNECVSVRVSHNLFE